MSETDTTSSETTAYVNRGQTDHDRGTSQETERVTLRIPAEQLAELDAAVEDGEYANRSAAIRQRADLGFGGEE